jgi:phospholipase C
VDIAHVVVLMLENRSFDCMLGRLYQDRDDFDGLKGTESNVWHKPDGTTQVVRVWNDPDLTAQSVVIPDPDPGELFSDIHMQINGIDQDPAPMGGFVDNYMRQPKADKPFDPRAVMHYFTPDQMPVISTLARSFGVCDRWFASAPNQTWPNRFFAHTGTANGYVNNSPPHFPYEMETVFNRLSKAGKDWNIYFHDFPQTATLANLWLHAGRFKRFTEDFAQDAAAGTLPAYSFIEPRFFADPLTGAMPNDEHPPHNVARGEQLVASVYNALRAGPGWGKTLFIITCDEHGGCYDHVVPPAATPPGPPYSDGFHFDRFGVRVPTVIVSPFVPEGSILRAPGAVPFDHTSIIATLRALFGIGPLTARDAAAPSILDVLNPLVTNNGPDFIVAPEPPPANVARATAASAQKPNGLQTSLNAAARALPPPEVPAEVHAAKLAATGGVATHDHPTVASAFAGVKERLAGFLDRA